MTTLDSVLRQARARLASGEAELLLMHVLGRGHAWLYAHGGDALSDQATLQFMTLVDRREGGEPVAYLTGRRGFWSLDLQVGPDTLIPRAETERLVELALERLRPGSRCRVADLGTGSGAVALAIARERPQAAVIATDASAAALGVARNNAREHGLENVEFRHGSWFEPLAGERFDLVASNPPYIAAEDPHLGQGDLRYEPAAALASGADGLDDVRAIAAAAAPHLLPGGWLLLEHGHDQGPAVRALLEQAGLEQVATAVDLEGRDRVSLGQRARGRRG